MSRLERRLARWQAQLAAGQLVELRIRWWLAWPLALVSFALAGLAGWLLARHRESAGESVLLAVLMVVLAAAGAAQAWVLLRRRGPAVVIARDGIHLPWQGRDVRWREVRGAGVRRIRLVPILTLELRGGDTLTLPFPLAADADHVAAWIDQLAAGR